MIRRRKRRGRRTAWWLLGTGVGALAALGARGALSAGWRAALGEEPPESPESGASWPRVVAWAGAAGALIALAQLGARQGTAAAWRRATGSDPPE